MAGLTWEDRQLYMNGQPFRIISGAMHYFRCVPEYWEDRLRKIKAMGCNTVETYVPWNLHEPREGEYNFEGITDIAKFIRVAEEVGLYVIVRPAPYICAEWEFGGLPAWLLNTSVKLRTSDQGFLDKVEAYYKHLLPLLTPLQITNGGPIIAMQIENEYGSYGNDQKYLQALRSMLIQQGVNVQLFTSDGPTDLMLRGGMAEGVWATVNFGSRAEEGFDKLLEYQPDAPLMCAEFWNGWFDHWKEEHHTRSSEDAAQALDEILAQGASVNFYMAHGGTNFGFMNGANHGEQYDPTVTSYDYDAPISEAGDLTPKFHAFREVISKYTELPNDELPSNTRKQAYGDIPVSRSVKLFDTLPSISTLHHSVTPEPMESYGQDYGFIMYSSNLPYAQRVCSLTLQDVHDRALVYLDQKYIGVVERTNPQELQLNIPEGGARLDILVENMGRINYGPKLASDRKGITEGVRLDYQFHYHWDVRTIPLDSIELVKYDISATAALDSTDEQLKEQPAFYEAELTIEDEPADTFLHLDGWKKGVAFVNGFNIGRYWEAGPTQSMYVPAPLLKRGVNHIVLFELHEAGSVISFKDEPHL